MRKPPKKAPTKPARRKKKAGAVRQRAPTAPVRPSKVSKVNCGSGHNQAGNLNSLRNGSKLGRDGLVVGNIPIKAVRDQARTYRRKLVAEVLKVRGCVDYKDLDAGDKHGIHAAVAAIAHAAICRWLFRTKMATMSPADVRATSKEIKDAARDAAKEVRSLKLDAPPNVIDLPEYIKAKS